MAVIKRIKTRRCTACKKVILIGESFERWSVGKARFVYCGSCAWQGGGLTPRVPDVAHCLCGGEYYTDKVLGVVCCHCQAPRR
mgnify:CR=1 FL=1